MRKAKAAIQHKDKLLRDLKLSRTKDSKRTAMKAYTSYCQELAEKRRNK